MIKINNELWVRPNDIVKVEKRTANTVYPRTQTQDRPTIKIDEYNTVTFRDKTYAQIDEDCLPAILALDNEVGL